MLNDAAIAIARAQYIYELTQPVSLGSMYRMWKLERRISKLHKNRK